MQFKNPELLYALFLLLIPIIIHLFQLRKFQKVDFTNVAFLKKVTLQTRKSSQLKKWLTLLIRLLALACIILAFAQPFTATKKALNTEKETVIYIDNSFSMQAKGEKGPLLQRAVQDLYEKISGTENVSWFTNDFSRKNSSLQDFKNEILQVDYSARQLSLNEILLKGNQLFGSSKTADKQLLIVSDFQGRNTFPDTLNDATIHAVQLQPVATQSVAIDSAYFEGNTTSSNILKVKITASETIAAPIPVSLYNNDVLVAKTAADLSEKGTTILNFDVDKSESFKGKLSVTEANLPYDNTLFFSINTQTKIKVLSINQANANFLQRLFDQPEFEYTQQTYNALDYNLIPNQNFIILNELVSIPPPLRTALESFTERGGNLLIIPSVQGEITEYNSLLANLKLGVISEATPSEKKITQIRFDHPLYKDVFEKRVVNFQYPKVNQFHPISTNAIPVLTFEDASPFLLQNGNSYVSTAPFNSENTNFQNSPLIVPTLFNMAKQSLSLQNLYYNIGLQNTFSVPEVLMQDEILEMRDSTFRFIPLQQTKANQVIITTNDEPAIAGTYDIVKDKTFIEHISYNYDRSESILQYANLENWKGVQLHNSITEVFNSLAAENSRNDLWKWFAIFALLFLITEMLILKFYK
ncbi:BatA domain-containing protein [Cochleicola gelatinilyticus]|uniref:Aerotolerance regulator N-terminal domain-containing protein n=1 Tax=Cochleicola gelatinilyticus TaxID=1763537 RepID=A0A167H270_9FLAO|nr:BatA domain-containing protein [Cochleicola gelatinilyticus]OAB78136.1 hypothetical protein ULVI_11685 [Cochleicola gelatinilyticus]